LEHARREADRANLAKSEFLSRMSHDLRTPLNAMMGFAQLLQFDRLTTDQADSVGYILRGGEHLLHLINEVLDIARIEAGHLILSPEPVSVADALEHTVALIRPIALKRGITLTIDAPPDVGVFADPQRLNQILLNLLSNAVKYNREAGAITVRTRAHGNRVCIEVADTGAGIPAHKLALLFTPFERLGAEQSGIEGTGLGLALSKRLAEQMNGTLTVESVVDSGTVFVVRLPAAEAVVEEEQPAPRAAITAVDYAGRILYIEDNVSNVVLMERLLAKRPGVVLRHASTGRTGLQMVTQERPDLVILDLHMADMPGEEILRHIKDDPATRDIPVAILSADATGESQRLLRSAGAIAYLTKPIEVADVLRLVDDVVGHTQ
jgi:CheY-like chemotaxis protein/two-component sensor histidine kinase